ncbi:Zeta toxin [Salinicola corii]|uniref:Zeta toxin n=1 Tax=Salinicola corii TaxID=2606937 RepID=A0A640WJE0_9GAMM|nr:zeta toxin family protein [Salinicola corii]KAA0020749.1 Zeta toxin [Salinicola corii]
MNNLSDEVISALAVDFAKKNKKKIARRITDKKIFPREKKPASVFMAGSPGAGKTEASLELLQSFHNEGGRVLRIDPDELRHEFEWYTGDNSWLFQYAVSILVSKVHDFALEQSQSFILDGTLSSLNIAMENVERSLGRGRFVQILYVYQDPYLAWDFVLRREADEGRNIRMETFVEQYFESRRVVHEIKRKHGKSVHVDLIVKNNDCSVRSYKAGVDRIDTHLPEKYTAESLLQGLPSRR